MKRKYPAGALALLATLMLLPGEAPADAGDQFSMDINISGSVVANGSCTFEKSEYSDVDFGDVTFQHAKAGNKLIGTYQKEIASHITCTGDFDGSTIMTFSNESLPVSYNGHQLLGISYLPDLAIEFSVNGIVQDINSAFTVDMQNPPTLTAELVQIGDGKSLLNNLDISTSVQLILAFN
ncbi:hypothetical protein VRB37_13045 [Erwinia billingiae]|uniref:hypothetical protein n=1 Tax=Erwinia billingiae TaxID=182337 RepID=UPI0030CFA8CF